MPPKTPKSAARFGGLAEKELQKVRLERARACVVVLVVC